MVCVVFINNKKEGHDSFSEVIKRALVVDDGTEAAIVASLSWE